MRYKTVSILCAALATLALAGPASRAQFLPTDWLTHRAGPQRFGYNATDPVNTAAPPAKYSVYRYPRSADMPAESVVDNVPSTGSISTGTMFPPSAGGVARWSNIAGWPVTVNPDFALVPATGTTWKYPSSTNPINTSQTALDRGSGAWPPSDKDVDRLGDYWYADVPDDPTLYPADAAASDVLKAVANYTINPNDGAGMAALQALPRASGTFEEPIPQAPFNGRNLYKTVDDALRTNTVYARWTFGTHYPSGTFQGSKQLPDNAPLAAGQRYAVYIRQPSPSTTLNPNTDWVFVRVSWGDDINDPTTSRIFMLNFGGTGGYWMRVRSAAKEDRYFPYDGQHPITVTLYTVTFSGTNEGRVPTIVPADAVRLVPEALRGDIHDPVASFHDATTNRNYTYFARDETTGPKDGTTPYNPLNPAGFQPIQLDPTRGPSPANPLVYDISESIRTPVFYCIQDQLPNGPFGKLRWKHAAMSPGVTDFRSTDQLPPSWVNGGGVFSTFTKSSGTQGSYGAGYSYHLSTDGAPTARGVWTFGLQNSSFFETYTVLVWIPQEPTTQAGPPPPNTIWAKHAHYIIATPNGNVDYYFDQDAAANSSSNGVGRGVSSGWHVLATGVRFGGANPTIAIQTDSPNQVDYIGSGTAGGPMPYTVVADAVQIVPESRMANSVVAAPLIASVTWPSGTARKVVYFATTGGQLWALDALGVQVNGAYTDNSSETTVFWTYPSIANPDPANQAALPNFYPENDPNNLPDGIYTTGTHGIDADLETQPGKVHKVVNLFTEAPALVGFRSSPTYVEIQRGNPPALLPMILIGADNGRIYAFDPAGRTNQDPKIGPINEPFPATFARNNGPGGGDVPGIPGTTRRIMTWPTTGRDKWLLAGAPPTASGPSFQQLFPDDASKGAFPASVSVKWAPGGPYPDHLVVGASESALLSGGTTDNFGHVYSVDLATLDPAHRISNFVNPQSYGQPKWVWPRKTESLGQITMPGVLTDTGKYVFTAPDHKGGGGRVYAIADQGNTATLQWVYPFTTTPGASPNPKSSGGTDELPEITPFTAPVWVPNATTDAGTIAEVVYVANTDGRLLAFDATQTGGQKPNAVWKDRRPNPPTEFRYDSDSLGTTRASATFIHWMTPFRQFRGAITTPGTGATPALLLPNDGTGDVVGFSAISGLQLWEFPDGGIGYVPLSFNPNFPAPPPNPAPVATFNTSQVWRGADAVTANSPAPGPGPLDYPMTGGWIYEGDEGNQASGEVNGQLRAYGLDQNRAGAYGGEGEPNINPQALAIDVRLANIWNGTNDSPPGPFDQFIPQADPKAPAQSPWNQRANARPPTQGNLLVYEWGDTLKVAAWGAFVYDPTQPQSCNVALPQVTFRLYTGTQQREQTVTGFVDTAWQPDAVLTLPLYVDPGPGGDGGCRVVPWVAKIQFQLGRGSEIDAQSPGRRYRIDVQARLTSNVGGTVYSNILSVGQENDHPYGTPGNTIPPPQDTLPTPPRDMAVAHPFAVTTAGYDVPDPSARHTGHTPLIGAPNVIGWTDNTLIDNSGNNLSELLANGNRLVDQTTFTPTMLKDLVAPVGMVGHGQSGVYTGVDPYTGNKVQALYVSDRSNLFKIRQPLNNLRVERSDMQWGWNPNNSSYSALQTATGNVMNPLPWESFPNTTPNVSTDYPDLDRSRAVWSAHGIDLSTRPVVLPFPDTTTVAGHKVLNPVPIDLQVNVPQYQPANINRDYFDINGALHPGDQSNTGLLAPMLAYDYKQPAAAGKDPVTAGVSNRNVRNLISPSAGYVGQYYLFIDTTNHGRLESISAPTASAQVIASGRDEVFRAVQVGVAVQPDISLRTEEETLDLGKLPQSAGYTPIHDFAPTDYGPYAGTQSLWDQIRTPGFFLPFTVENTGNVNLVNLRTAKISWPVNPATNQPVPLQQALQDSHNWTGFKSDQVESGTGAGVVWGPSFNLLGAPGAGNIGVVSTLDHKNVDNTKVDYQDVYGISATNPFWPRLNPYVQAGNVLNWSANAQPAPTLHKALPGDSGPTTMSLPDVQHGDPQGLVASISGGNQQLNIIPHEPRPEIGVAVPLGTPVGTYSAPVYTFEDNMPLQWRQWSGYYANTTGNVDPLASYGQGGYGPDDGLLSVFPTTGKFAPIESVTNPTFNLKFTVTEAQMTDAPAQQVTVGGTNTYVQSNGSYPQVDVRPVGAAAFGANVQVAAWRNASTASAQSPPNLYAVWATNRLSNPGGPLPWQPPSSPNTPWYLLFSQLDSVFGNNPVFGPVFDWQFEPVTGNLASWWTQPSRPGLYPSQVPANNLFPSSAADVPNGMNLPTVPGVINQASIRHGAPGIAQDDDPTKASRPTWLFWQGTAYKTTSAGGQASRTDSRTFYAPLPDGGPNPTAVPYSFLNDPQQPKYAPKPIILTDRGGTTRAYLFWYGGAEGRTRLYYNMWPSKATNAAFLTDTTLWTPDQALPVPGTLEWSSDPVPVHRQVMYNGQIRDAIDLVYTGALTGHGQSETILTRYFIQLPADATADAPAGSLVGWDKSSRTVAPLPLVDQEVLARVGASQTWQSRDLAWVTRDPATNNYLDANGKPTFAITVTHADGTVANGGNPINTGNPTRDPATGRLYFNSALGGQLVVDSQNGQVIFPSTPPAVTDRVTLHYTPQSMRLNTTRDDTSGLPADPNYPTANPIPAALVNLPGFAPQPAVAAPGANTEPVSFIDRSINPMVARDADPTNPYPSVMLAGPNGGPAPLVDRMWVLYRKTNAGSNAPAAFYYKTMRLTARLPAMPQGPNNTPTPGVVLDAPTPPGVKPDARPHVRISGNLGPVEIDWARGRLYFTEADEGNKVTVTFDYGRDQNGNVQSVGPIDYRVRWEDEANAASGTADEPIGETLVPTEAAVNEGGMSAFKDPQQDKVWVFWTSTRNGTTSLFYMALNPRFYKQVPGAP